MNNISSFFKFGLSYAKNYFLESLAVRFPQIVPKPLYVGLSVGTVCNLRCRHCDLWQIKTEPEKYLNTKEIKKILVDLKNWLGPFRLTFTGAEPFVRQDMVEILEFASWQDIYTVITSNGWLIDQGLAQEIVDTGIDVVNISLDGSNSQTHDFLRGKKGAFKKVVKALEFLQKTRGNCLQPAIYINTVVMDNNLDQLMDLVRITNKLKIDSIRFQALESKWLFGAHDYDPNWFKKDLLWPKDKNKIKKTFNQLKGLKKRSFPVKNTFQELNDLRDYYLDPRIIARKHRFCFTGVRNFAIDEYGRVKLCFGMGPVGDLRKQTPQEIWYGRKAQILRKKIANCRRYCRILPCNKRENLSQIWSAFLKKIKG